ncbi:hypothetical protein ACH5RR_016216 [Cinchona calisaya]|uniref:Uncharacterized protein n=1 Tax=Cinchona calisaya TaxID=153742 RepID=A0ABD2ZYZ9_9GENT
MDSSTRSTTNIPSKSTCCQFMLPQFLPIFNPVLKTAGLENRMCFTINHFGSVNPVSGAILCLVAGKLGNYKLLKVIATVMVPKILITWSRKKQALPGPSTFRISRQAVWAKGERKL